MKLYVCAFFDRGTSSFGTPMFLMNQGHALRAFSDEVNRKADDNIINKHPDDFDLYELGEFDSETGLFSSSSPRQISSGKAVLL